MMFSDDDGLGNYGSVYVDSIVNGRVGTEWWHERRQLQLPVLFFICSPVATLRESERETWKGRAKAKEG
jgi:hypothetical protein